MTRRQLDRVVAQLAAGNGRGAIALLCDLEWQAFRSRDRVAGELGYARSRAECGDLAGAADVLRDLARGRV